MPVSQNAAQPLQSDAQMYSQRGLNLQLPVIPQWTSAAVSISAQAFARDRDFTDKQQALGEVDVGGIVLSHPSKPSRSTFRLVQQSLLNSELRFFDQQSGRQVNGTVALCA